MKISGAEILIDCLKKEGVKHIFFIHILPIIVINFIITGVYFVLLDAGMMPPFVESLHHFFTG